MRTTDIRIAMDTGMTLTITDTDTITDTITKAMTMTIRAAITTPTVQKRNTSTIILTIM